MDTIEMKPGDLTLDPENARKRGPGALDAIKASLAQFGQQKPVVIDANAKVVAGNGTVQAAIELGLETVACVVTDLEGPAQRAYAIADNRTAEMAKWDADALQGALEALEAEPTDELFAATGFTSEELEAMRGAVGEPWDPDGPNTEGQDEDNADKAGIGIGEDPLFRVIASVNSEDTANRIVQNLTKQGIDARVVEL